MIISQAYIRATERDHWGRNEHRQSCRAGSEGSGGWWGGPQSRKLKLSTGYCWQYNQQWIWTRVCWWSIQAAECAFYSPVNRWVCSRPHSIREPKDDPVPAHKYSIRGLPGTNVWRNRLWAMWFIVRRWVWDSNLPGALVIDEIGLWQTFSWVAAAMFCELVIGGVVMGLPLLILWGNTLQEWVILANYNLPGIVSEKQDWYPLQRSNSVPRCLLEIN